ncbi:macrophage mannose receptor 1-like isoform X1 [Arapaima gigas]
MIRFSETSNGTLNLTLVTQSLPWYDALNYCRQKYSDLVSIRNANESEAVRNAVKTGIEFWIGLYNDPWKWSDGQNPNFTSWKNPVTNSYKQCVYINTVGTWVLYVCTATAPFFCSGLPTTYRAVVRFTLKGLTADQNPDDPLLAEQVLNQIKEQLSQKTSLDNTTFTWRQQYGKIFQESYENFPDMCGIPGT